MSKEYRIASDWKGGLLWSDRVYTNLKQATKELREANAMLQIQHKKDTEDFPDEQFELEQLHLEVREVGEWSLL